MAKPNILAQIQLRKAKAPKKRMRVQPKWLYPNSQEREFHRDLKSLVGHLRKQIIEILLPEIPSMIQEVKSNTPNVRTDQYLDRLKSMMLRIRENVSPYIDATIFKMKMTGESINIYNKQQFKKIMDYTLGIDIFQDEPWLLDQLKLFSSQNSQLITSLPDQELDRVASIVERGLQEGKLYTEVKKEIQKSFGISDRRAKLIARDQTKKLNSNLTKLRQQELGVEEYIWQTSGDERVRATHRANDGKKFRWDKPPPVTGHPGNDINCRCVAKPVLDNLLNLG
jgi:SPP1 gp7 family putative phage head morphogenesis protein